MKLTIPNHVIARLIHDHLAQDIKPGYEIIVTRVATDDNDNAQVHFRATKKGKRTKASSALILKSLDQKLFDSLLEFNFSSRINKALQSAGFHSLWQLAILSQSAMNKIPEIHKASVAEIMRRLREIPDYDSQAAVLRCRARAAFFPKVLNLGIQLEFQLARHDEATETFVSKQVGKLTPVYGHQIKTATPC